MSNEKELSRIMVRQTQNRFLFLVLLTIVLIALKLTGFIEWDWIWVLAPALMVLIACGAILLVSGIMAE